MACITALRLCAGGQLCQLQCWHALQVAEKHGSLKVVVYEGLKWHHRQAQEDAKLIRKMPSTKNKAAVSFSGLFTFNLPSISSHCDVKCANHVL